MKNKYISTDWRTGYPEGSVVELTIDELNKVPFNVGMRFVADKSEDDRKHLEQIAVKEAKASLRVLLLSKGLSTHRTDMVLDKYPTRALLEENAESAGIDKLTDEFIKSNFHKERRIRKDKEVG